MKALIVYAVVIIGALHVAQNSAVQLKTQIEQMQSDRIERIEAAAQF